MTTLTNWNCIGGLQGELKGNVSVAGATDLASGTQACNQQLANCTSLCQAAVPAQDKWDCISGGAKIGQVTVTSGYHQADGALACNQTVPACQNACQATATPLAFPTGSSVGWPDGTTPPSFIDCQEPIAIITDPGSTQAGDSCPAGMTILEPGQSYIFPQMNLESNGGGGYLYCCGSHDSVIRDYIDGTNSSDHMMFYQDESGNWQGSRYIFGTTCSDADPSSPAYCIRDPQNIFRTGSHVGWSPNCQQPLGLIPDTTGVNSGDACPSNMVILERGHTYLFPNYSMSTDGHFMYCCGSHLGVTSDRISKTVAGQDSYDSGTTPLYVYQDGDGDWNFVHYSIPSSCVPPDCQAQTNISGVGTAVGWSGVCQGGTGPYMIPLSQNVSPGDDCPASMVPLQPSLSPYLVGETMDSNGYYKYCCLGPEDPFPVVIEDRITHEMSGHTYDLVATEWADQSWNFQLANDRRPSSVLPPNWVRDANAYASSTTHVPGNGSCQNFASLQMVPTTVGWAVNQDCPNAGLIELDQSDAPYFIQGYQVDDGGYYFYCCDGNDQIIRDRVYQNDGDLDPRTNQPRPLDLLAAVDSDGTWQIAHATRGPKCTPPDCLANSYTAPASANRAQGTATMSTPGALIWPLISLANQYPFFPFNTIAPTYVGMGTGIGGLDPGFSHALYLTPQSIDGGFLDLNDTPCPTVPNGRGPYVLQPSMAPYVFPNVTLSPDGHYFYCIDGSLTSDRIRESEGGQTIPLYVNYVDGNWQVTDGQNDVFQKIVLLVVIVLGVFFLIKALVYLGKLYLMG